VGVLLRPSTIGARLSLYLATDAWTPDRPAPAGDRADLQAALIEHVKQQGLDRDAFGTADRLGLLVLKEDCRQATSPGVAAWAAASNRRWSARTPAPAQCP
jgi:hypothetical protein